MPTIAGKVALITGAARGQGRSHAVRLARDGADIVAIDLCDQIDLVGYPMAVPADLEETRRLVEGQDRRIVAVQADVRSFEEITAAVSQGVSELGPIDIVLANAGISPAAGPGGNDNMELWRAVIDVNLTGVWNTIQAGLPSMIEKGEGGSVVITGSTAALKGFCNGNAGAAAYTAAKSGLLGITSLLATELAPQSIRVNIVHPTGVDTPMINNDYIQSFLQRTRNGQPTLPNAMPVTRIDANDISEAISWLVSPAARYVTGVSLPVDAGFSIL